MVKSEVTCTLASTNLDKCSGKTIALG